LPAPSASAHAPNDVTDTRDSPNTTLIIVFCMRAPYVSFALGSSYVLPTSFSVRIRSWSCQGLLVIRRRRSNIV